MAMGRGSCTTAVLLTLLLIIYSPCHTLAATYVVGDSQGWELSMSYTDWTNGKSFLAGDILVFNYQPGEHTVVPVTAAGYKNCKAPADASKVATTGSDKFTLKKGANYFICSIPGHCAAGMRLQVIAQ